MGAVPNFSLSTGCAPPPSTPIENVAAFVLSGKQALAELSPYASLLNDLSSHIFSGYREPVPKLVRQAKAAGTPQLTIIRSGLMRAVRKGSALYEERRCHLPAILLMVDAFYDGFAELEQDLSQQEETGQNSPQLIIGTVRGDIHEIGKNLVRLILQAHGLRVQDLGVNVPADAFLLAAKEAGGPALPVIGLSAFVTSARKELARVIELFHNEGLDTRIILGGAAVNQRIAGELGAAGYARDAVAAVKLMERLIAV
jgi:methanogenic corrinoid protein MtbC1